jgi:NAD(P)-dependent dehydrogenase (short-subunit alcohol dehydrogenase family)
MKYDRSFWGGVRMDLRLTGQMAFITGGSKGIGRECAYQLAQEGCSVAITARDAAATLERGPRPSRPRPVSGSSRWPAT